MQIFHCDGCSAVVFFENTCCLSCGARLAFIPEIMAVGALKQDPKGIWRSDRRGASPVGYKLCRNARDILVCNEAVPADSNSELCRWCEFTDMIPDLSLTANRERWRKLNSAQRRLLYSVWKLGLEVAPQTRDPQRGLTFRFLADTSSQVLTGHAGGVVTLNIAEADDDAREARRKQMGEEYRTLLGHFRHEVGHYFWERLIQDRGKFQTFRALFGDERQDYGRALQNHYRQGAPADWQQRHISKYATAHPWEDWAETWAHYLHMTAVLETAASCGLSLDPARSEQPSVDVADIPAEQGEGSFTKLIEAWTPVTIALNALNRSIGLNDAYPFVLNSAVIEKLRFIHHTIRNS